MKQLTCVCVLAAGLASMMLPMWGQERGKGKTYALLVACANYTSKGDFNPLPHTTAEMKEFRQTLIDSGVAADNIILIQDKQEDDNLRPGKERVLEQLDLLASSLKEADTLIVALNGHGLHFKGDKVGYFIPYDGEFEDKATLLAMSGKGGLFEKLSGCAARRKLLIVNACRNEVLAANDQARRAQIDDADEEEVPKGIAALYSCKEGQRSFFYPKDEGPKVERSLFYHHVIEAWRGKYAGGKAVTLEHLFEEVGDRTAEDAHKLFDQKQIPEVRRKYDGRWVVAAPAPAPKMAKEIPNSIGMKLVYVPAGRFMRGSSKQEQDDATADYEKLVGGKAGQSTIDIYRAEGPQREVEITKGFYMGVHEVTQGEYQEIMGTNPSWFSATGNGKDSVKDEKDTTRFPVERVSWQDAQDFLDKLNARAEEKKKGRKYRLPTEGEWEYTARRGYLSKTKESDPFSFGKSLSSTQANFDGNYPYGGAAKGPYLGRTCKVGSYAANGLGIHDMHGNVWEWCADRYDKDYYANSPRQDPPGPEKGLVRVIRGGGWYDVGQSCRSPYRDWFEPACRYDGIGFRVLAVPSRQE